VGEEKRNILGCYSLNAKAGGKKRSRAKKGKDQSRYSNEGEWGGTFKLDCLGEGDQDSKVRPVEEGLSHLNCCAVGEDLAVEEEAREKKKRGGGVGKLTIS